MKHRILVAALALALLAPVSAGAAEPVSVTVGTYHKLRIAQPADSILVADPAVADVLLLSPRLLFVLGRQPGETNLFVLDKSGREIMSGPIVVVPRAERQVTIHRRTEELTFSCAPLCAEVPTPAGGSAAAAAAAAQAPAQPPAEESGG